MCGGLACRRVASRIWENPGGIPGFSSHPVDGFHELDQVGLGDSPPAFDGPVEGAADEFAARFGWEVMHVHCFDERGVLVGSYGLVCRVVSLFGVASVVVLVGEDAEDGGEAVAASVGDGAADLLRVSGHEEGVFADGLLFVFVEDDCFDGADDLPSVSGPVEGDLLGECDAVFFEDGFDVLEEGGEVEVLVGAAAGVGGFVCGEVRDFVEDLHEFLAEVVVFHFGFLCVAWWWSVLADEVGFGLWAVVVLLVHEGS